MSRSLQRERFVRSHISTNPPSGERFGCRKGLLVLRTVIVISTLVPAGSAETPRRELPVLVTIRELMEDPERYDGRRVVVMARVRSIELQKGRRGGDYIVMVLEQSPSESKGRMTDDMVSIQVFSLTLPPVREGQRAVVQGVYHREAMAGGLPLKTSSRPMPS